SGPVEMEAATRQESMIGKAGSPAGEKLPRPVHAVFARGGDDYFAVVTVQRPGQPTPEVTVDGEGLDATITVGKRTIRFDGEKIVFGQ
ncbi:MAG: hypothetical protein ACOC93_01915, partial [Planctomycetota bacterium]